MTGWYIQVQSNPMSVNYTEWHRA